jgi:hypothetical protein
MLLSVRGRTHSFAIDTLLNFNLFTWFILIYIKWKYMGTSDVRCRLLTSEKSKMYTGPLDVHEVGENGEFLLVN